MQSAHNELERRVHTSQALAAEAQFWGWEAQEVIQSPLVAAPRSSFVCPRPLQLNKSL